MEAGASLFTDLFWATLAFIFLAGIIGTIIGRRQKDRCLKLLDDFHVTLARNSGEVFWGDLRVYPQGLEVEFDTPHATRLGTQKTGVLIYEKELGDFVGVLRTFSELTQAEKIQREDQVVARFQPGAMRRFMRGMRNWVGTVQDAFGQALSLFLGQMQKSNIVFKNQKNNMQNMGNQLIGFTGNAWEPMLERLLGKPVVVELKTDAMGDEPMSLSGYLAEYSSKYIAIFTTHKDQGEAVSLNLTAELSHPAFELTQADGKWVLRSKALRPWVIEKQEWAGNSKEVGSILTKGSAVVLPQTEQPSVVWGRELKEVDAVLSRAHAVVRYAGARL